MMQTMFGKKKDTEKKKHSKIKEAPMQGLRLEVMPSPFYGGSDPQIYHEQTPPAPKPVQPTVTQPQQPPAPTTPQQPGVQPKHFSRKKIIVIAAALFILCIAFISWYYIQQSRPQQPTRPEQLPPPVLENTQKPSAASSSQSQPSATTSSVSQPTTTPPVSLQDRIEFPTILFRSVVDVDADQLTDAEEEIFTTDSGTWDTDTDGYFDGQEVSNLYNPKGFAPKKLIDSGLVREYVHPGIGYRLYYPTEWRVGVVDPDGRQVVISAITGDYIQVRVFERKIGESFPQWFARVVQGERFTDVTDITNRFQVEGKRRSDGFVAYYLTESQVFTLSYHPSDTGLLYPHIMEMVVQSFRPTKTTVDIPEQLLLPGSTPESSTSTPTSTPAVVSPSTTSTARTSTSGEEEVL